MKSVKEQLIGTDTRHFVRTMVFNQVSVRPTHCVQESVEVPGWRVVWDQIWRQVWYMTRIGAMRSVNE